MGLKGIIVGGHKYNKLDRERQIRVISLKSGIETNITN